MKHGRDLIINGEIILAGTVLSDYFAGWMQQALGGVSVDGRVGPQTLAATTDAAPVPVIQKACKARMGFLRGLRTWHTFGRGWSRRVASVEAVSVRMAVEMAGEKARPMLVKASKDARQTAQREGQADEPDSLRSGVQRVTHCSAKSDQQRGGSL
ncbi:MAG: putative peptidoglycan-binding domain-containing protein [Roseinatronobacter sp.]